MPRTSWCARGCHTLNSAGEIVCSKYKESCNLYLCIYISPNTPGSSVGTRQSIETMKITLPRDTMFDTDLKRYVHILSIPHFRGVMMRDELSNNPLNEECGILNLNTHNESGSHWICWYKNRNDRYFFDSFGESPPIELLKYLKTQSEYQNNLPVIRRSAITVQHYYSNECGSLCLYMLKKLTNGVSFPKILIELAERFNKLSSPPLTINI